MATTRIVLKRVPYRTIDAAKDMAQFIVDLARIKSSRDTAEIRVYNGLHGDSLFQRPVIMIDIITDRRSSCNAIRDEIIAIIPDYPQVELDYTPDLDAHYRKGLTL